MQKQGALINTDTPQNAHEENTPRMATRLPCDARRKCLILVCNAKKLLAEILPGILLAVIFALAAGRFAWVQAALLRTEAAGGGTDAFPFLLASLALTLGPGLFVWRFFRLSTDNAALFLTHILATSLGVSMLVPWALLGFGLWTRSAAIGVAIGAGALGVCALVSFAATGTSRAATRRGIRVTLRSTTLSEALSLALALAAGELLFELLAGYPMQGWDAFLSWDKWAADHAGRRSLGGYVLGFYPQGLPLLGSLFYKALPPAAGIPYPASTAHLLLHGFHAVFPLLLLLSVSSLSRPLGFNPLLGQALVLSDFFLVQSLLKQMGDADVPLTAFCGAALAIALFHARGDAGRRAPSAAIPAFFALAFVKGSGLAMGLLLGGILVLRRPRGITVRRVLAALAIGFALAAPFYLHQAAMARFPSLAEHSPFLLTLPLEKAHTDLFTPNVAHLVDWLRKTGPNLGLDGGNAVSYAASGIVAALLLAALVLPKARPVALAAFLWFVLWFFTGSYDWRNAFPGHLLAVLALAAVFRSLADLPRWSAMRTALDGALVVASFVLLARQRLPELACDRFARRPPTPPVLALPEADRPSAISSLRDSFALYQAVPFLRDAPHLRMPGRDYRLLPNGVRGIPYHGADAFTDPRPGDLCFARRRFFAATKDYSPVATLRGPAELGDTLLLFRPRPMECGFRGRRTSKGEWICSCVVPDKVRIGFLEIEFPPDRFPNGIPEGFSVEEIYPDGLSRTDAALAKAFDTLFRPVVLTHNCVGSKKPVVRRPFWFPADSDAPPEFRFFADNPLPQCPESVILASGNADPDKGL